MTTESRRETGSHIRSVRDVLSLTAVDVVGLHLEWLAAKARGQPQLSHQRVLYEDQAKILIDALVERNEHDVVLQALRNTWSPEDHDGCHDLLDEYVADLDRVTAGEPAHSPYRNLAQSSARLGAAMKRYDHSPSS